jgi:peptidoglycan/LPS O-acetylase OafA/YrhL
MILAAPLFRAFALQLAVGEVAFYTLTPSSFDSLGVGALLAVASHAHASDGNHERLLRYTALPAGLAGMALATRSLQLFAIFGETLVALVFVWLVAGASRGFGGVGKLILEARPILYLGRISYGIYVYHLLVPDVFGPALDALGVQLAPKGIVAFLVFSSLTVVLASASWFLIENPINRLKRRFSLPA